MVDLLSAGRAYVRGESIWSRAHHAAVFHLDRFAETGDPERLRMAREKLEIPLADRLVRLELEKPEPDFERARTLFAAGGNHPEDVPRMVRLFRHFRNWPEFSQAVELWGEADVWIVRLDHLADELEALWAAPAQSAEQITSIRSELSLISRALNEKAGEFSFAVNQGSRWLSSLVFWISIFSLALLVALLIALFAWAMRGVRRSQRRFWNTFEHAPVGMALMDSEGLIMDANDSLCRFLERGPDDIVSSSLTRFCDARDRSVLRRTLSERNQTAIPLLDLESRYLRPDGSRAWGKLSIAPLGEEIKGNGLLVAVLEDISESRSLSAELAYQAAHDQLTGLANRREFERALNHLLHDSESSSGRHA
ncbi:MAG TPA: PAS domain-containing protein, partial [Sphingomonadaceae bacterium]|nr:PAS domain-containing protein [Sphingomonadaceae bacterium]